MRRRGLEILSALGMVIGLAGSLFCETVPGETLAPLSARNESDQSPLAQAVAEVLGQKIVASDLEPDSLLEEEPTEGMDAREKQKWIEGYRKQRIVSLIFGPLLEEYAKDQKIVSSDAEIEPLIRLLSNDESLKEQKVTEQQFLDQLKVRKEELDQILKDPALSPEKEGDSFEELIRLEKAISQMEEETLEEELEKTASQIVKAWKANQALYEKYKGRVIFQQAGPEPLDAYRQFLEEKQKAGAFQIYDEKLAKLFWEYFVNEDRHVFASPEEADRLMKSPWWLTP